MGTLAEAKTLGGVGAILALLTIIPYAGPVLAIVGLILKLIAVNYISHAVAERNIFNNYLISVILGIIGIVVGAVAVFGSILGFVGLGSLSEWSVGPSAPVVPTNVWGLIAGIIIGVVLMWVFYLISAIFLRRSFDSIADRLGVKMFSTAALIYLIGAALAIILVGFIIVFIADILIIVAFFSIPQQIQQPETTGDAKPVERFCIGCGRAVSPDIKFCPNCGKELPP